MIDLIESLGKWGELAITRWWMFQSMWQRYGIGKVIEKWTHTH